MYSAAFEMDDDDLGIILSTFVLHDGIYAFTIDVQGRPYRLRVTFIRQELAKVQVEARIYESEHLKALDKAVFSLKNYIDRKLRHMQDELQRHYTEEITPC